jgi:hypothetical protein
VTHRARAGSAIRMELGFRLGFGWGTMGIAGVVPVVILGAAASRLHNLSLLWILCPLPALSPRSLSRRYLSSEIKINYISPVRAPRAQPFYGPCFRTC